MIKIHSVDFDRKQVFYSFLDDASGAPLAAYLDAVIESDATLDQIAAVALADFQSRKLNLKLKLEIDAAAFLEIADKLGKVAGDTNTK